LRRKNWKKGHATARIGDESGTTRAVLGEKKLFLGRRGSGGGEEIALAKLEEKEKKRPQKEKKRGNVKHRFGRRGGKKWSPSREGKLGKGRIFTSEGKGGQWGTWHTEGN